LATNTLDGLVVRVDDRLIHGQILYGWIPVWKADQVWLADDYVANNEDEKKIYSGQLSGSIEGGVLNIRDAIKRFTGSSDKKCRILLIVKSCEDLAELIKGGLCPNEAHLGNISSSKNRKSFNENVALGNKEEAILKTLYDKGIEVVIRDLPGSEPISLKSFIRRPPGE